MKFENLTKYPKGKLAKTNDYTRAPNTQRPDEPTTLHISVIGAQVNSLCHRAGRLLAVDVNHASVYLKFG